MVGFRMDSNNRPRRLTEANQHTNKYVCKPVKAKAERSREKDNNLSIQPRFSKPKRAQYFRVYRSERTALKVCMNTYMPTEKITRKTYRALHYMYYKVIPYLARYLWFPPDRANLLDLEHIVYNQILSYRFIKDGQSEPKRVQLWLNRSPTYEVGQ